ncbi:TPA: hypothetical protein ACS7XC_002366 [Providencia alcalifaciens]
MNKYFVVLFFAFLSMGCSKSNISPYTAQTVNNRNQVSPDAWIKVKYDIDENMRAKNIEFIDSHNSNKEFERAIINNMNKWRFEDTPKGSGYIITVYFSKESANKLKK